MVFTVKLHKMWDPPSVKSVNNESPLRVLTKGWEGVGQNRLALPQLCSFFFFSLLDAPEANLLFKRGITSNQLKYVLIYVKSYYSINFAAKA